MVKAFRVGFSCCHRDFGAKDFSPLHFFIIGEDVFRPAFFHYGGECFFVPAFLDYGREVFLIVDSIAMTFDFCVLLGWGRAIRTVRTNRTSRELWFLRFVATRVMWGIMGREIFRSYISPTPGFVGGDHYGHGGGCFILVLEFVMGFALCACSCAPGRHG